MDVETLARIQFAATVSFHYIYPPLSIGLGLVLVIIEGLYLKTQNPLYKNMAKFWLKIFSITFALGVATGIVLEFEFGTNWAAYARYVGDIFGSALAAEGIFAFFLESGFLAILVFGWDKVSPKMHFFSTLVVFLGSIFSAVWIIVANSWQQTPAGYVLEGTGSQIKAKITDFWSMVFNPSAVDRLMHTVLGALLAGAFLVTSISAYYLLKKRHLDFAKVSMKIGLLIALFTSIAQIWTGHISAQGVSKNQPEKLAALEGHYHTGPLALHAFGWVNEGRQEVIGSKIPIKGLGSLLVSGNFDKIVKGLDQFPEENWPPVNRVFQVFHLMVALGFGMLFLAILGTYTAWKGTLWNNKFVLWLLVFGVIAPQLANQAGWFTAEMGRQPWIVYHLLKTSDGLSKVVHSDQVLTSLTLFFILYNFLFALFLFLLTRKIMKGPDMNDADIAPYYHLKKEH